MRARKSGQMLTQPDIHRLTLFSVTPQRPELCEEGTLNVKTAQSLLTASARGRRIPRAAWEAGL